MPEEEFPGNRNTFHSAPLAVTHEPETIRRETQQGKITICSFCAPDKVEPLSFEEMKQEYEESRPILYNKESLISAASNGGTNVCVAFTDQNEIVGCGILEPPRAGERWLDVGKDVMKEVSVIEVSRSWRCMGLAKEILRLLVDHPSKANHILYMVGYSWTWDLQHKGFSPMFYRDILIKLFSGQGFRSFQTNEPNVMLRPENLFMARMGENISDAVRERFKLVRFDLAR